MNAGLWERIGRISPIHTYSCARFRSRTRVAFFGIAAVSVYLSNHFGWRHCLTDYERFRRVQAKLYTQTFQHHV